MVRNETREILEIIINDLVFPFKKKIGTYTQPEGFQ